MNIVNEMMDFLYKSPTAFNAIENIKNILIDKGFTLLNDHDDYKVEKGKNYFVICNNSSLIAFKVGKNLKDDYGFNIVSSHSDSPCFKLKPNYESNMDIYNKINVEPYGGMICSTWLDRPLNVAGRVLYEDDGFVKTKIVNLDKDLLMIPNMCIHFNRDINSGHQYRMDSEMQAFISQNIDGPTLSSLISKEVEGKKILRSDLYLCNHQKPVIWGLNNEYISSPRLDDLECVFTSLKGFIDGGNDSNVSVLAIFDNEEVGSSSRQGADSNFLKSTLKRINSSLGMSKESYYRALATSFMISADNAHAVHPNNPGITDFNNHVYMNKGIVIKFNASQTYTSDGITASILEQFLLKNDIPYQFFANRSDIRGGSTLGNIANSHVSVLTVDIGLGQLAMHSSYETAGKEDVTHAYNLFKAFYSSKLAFDNEGNVALK